MADTLSPQNGDSFTEVLKAAREIKQKFVDPRIRWYDSHKLAPRLIYRVVGILTIMLSVTLPGIGAFPVAHKDLAITLIGIAIAALTSLGSFYQWDRMWRANSTSLVALEQAVAKWEIELKRAEFVLASADRVEHVIKATDDLIANTGTVVSSESEGFFSNLHAPQQNSAGKP